MLGTLNHVFALVFTLEFIVKFIALGCNYFRDSWNLIDFFIVVTSIFEVLLEYIFQVKSTNTLSLVRTFRIVRILKLIKRFKELRRILLTFINAIPELANVGTLLFLFLYMYAVIGVYLFS